MSEQERHRLAPDEELRRRAIDPAHSYLVQAPAGSGKTELLTRRVLCLLAQVERPESILAITFTRKAAREMRQRILQALEEAGRPLSGDEVLPPHKQTLRALATAALEHDRRLGWHLLDAPQRLQIRTFDSFCESVARQLPLLAGLGDALSTTADADPLYSEAAMRTIAMLGEGTASPRAEAVAVLLRAVDNRMTRLRDLLAGMLARRAQWLDLIGGSHLLSEEDLAELRPRLEAAFAGSIAAELRTVRTVVAQALGAQLPELLRAIRHAAAEADAESEFRLLESLRELPAAAAGALPQWRALSRMLLTSSYALRKFSRAGNGFSRAAAALFHEALEPLRESSAESALEDRLAEVAKYYAPPVHSDEDWRFLRALLAVLPLSAAQLSLVESERGQVDFAAVAMAATTALRTGQGPTDLGLALGGRIQHLLVDEYQDTSRPQLWLLQALTSVWEAGEGCTIFAVGDPMQSIYAFREAEVRNFTESWQQRTVAELPVEALRLVTNFRSKAALVGWFNRVFPGVLGVAGEAKDAEDLLLDRVRYSPAEAMPAAAAENAPAVSVRGFAAGEYAAEADCVASAVEELLQRDAAQPLEKRGRIAILVRARSHLRSIVPALQKRAIRFRAVEIEPLGERQTVRDLQSIACALLDPSDRTSWLAVLRAPWCGLALADLWTLCRGDSATGVLRLLEERLPQLSEDGRLRAARVLAILSDSLRLRGAMRLSLLVERTWLSLGGVAALKAGERAAALREADAFLQLLDECAAQRIFPGTPHFGERLAKLFAPPDSDPEIRVELLTIHKAKGLEWEHVILPALGRKPPQSETQLLYWRTVADGGEDSLLLAPLGAPAEANGKDVTLERYLRWQSKRRQAEEVKRLFYVAATRARDSLLLTANLPKINKKGEMGQPSQASILKLIWEAPSAVAETLGEEFRRTLAPQTAEPLALAAAAESTPATLLRRLPSGWQLPAPPEPLRWQGSAPAVAVDAPMPGHTFEWATLGRRALGTVVHACLQQIAREGLACWSCARIDELAGAMRASLLAAGVPPEELPAAQAELRLALGNILDDKRGRWILDAHAEAASEFPLTVATPEGARNLRIDRTFVDEQGTRWIVDFKLTHRAGGEAGEFLEAQVEKYREDLLRYREALRKLKGDAAPIRCALYFPLQRQWREVDAGGE
jgi:ATP-dependent exoDNAse (exonuclease V) beta subunit